MLDVAKLARTGILKRYETDEVFFDQGDPGHEMFILLKGKAVVSIKSVDGFSVPLNDIEAGDFFGEMSLLENLPRSATIQAMEECLVIVITEENFEQIIAEQPNLAFRIMKGMSKRLRHLNEEIEQLKKISEYNSPDNSTEIPSNASEILAATEAIKDNPPADEKPFLHNSDLFPPLHKSYPLIAPVSDEEYLFAKEVNCPVCAKSFSVKMMRSSKLKLQSVDPDQRQRFVNFNPLWYIMWVCPHCYYANFHFAFKQVSEASKKNIKQQFELLKKKIHPDFSNPRILNEVFTAYYLALNCIKTNKAASGQMANIWLRLSWLYQDAEDQDMYQYSSAQALEGFKESYYNGRRNASQEQDQRLTLLMGELSLRIGNTKEALDYFRNSIIRKGGSSILNRQAEDRIQELKTMV